MKLQDYRNDFYAFSGKASDVNRQLAFAGIAIIWLFKKEPAAGAAASALSLPHDLLLPGIFIVVGLMLDIAQYCVGSITWYLFYRSLEKAGVSEKKDIKKHSEWLERPISALFWLKIVSVALAYIAIFQYLLTAIQLR